MRHLVTAAALGTALIGTALSVHAAPAGRPPAAARLGEVRYIFGGLSIQSPGRTAQPAIVRNPVGAGDFLRTGTRQKASIGFRDGTVLHINQLTDLVLRSPHLTVVQSGEVAEYLAPGTNHRVQSNATFAAAIGTTFDVKVEPDRATYTVLHGALQVSNQLGAVVVKSEQQTIVLTGRAPAPPTPADAEAVFAWTDTIPTPDLGEDIALDANGGVVVGKSSQRGGRWGISHIDDGLLSRGWESGNGQARDQWVKVAFTLGGRLFRISKVIIDPAATGGDPATEDLKDFEIRVSSTGTDEASFTTVFVGTCKQENRLQPFPIDSLPLAKYVELRALTNWGSTERIAVAEWEVVANISQVGLSAPFGVAVDGRGTVYVSDSGNHRIQRLSPTGQFERTLGSKGTEPGRFRQPAMETVDAAGNLYVADTTNNRIQKLSPNGAPLGQWGSFGSGFGQLEAPTAVALDAAGNLYVTDTGNDRVEKFAPDGRPLLTWGRPGVSPGELNDPVGIALDTAGAVYVADAGNERIQKFTSSGAYLLSWGTQGDALGEFDGPFGIAIDAAGDVLVADYGNSRVQKFTPTGRALATWRPHAVNSWGYPVSLALDRDGNVYVGELGNSTVVKLSPDGQQLDQWGVFGSIPQLIGVPSDVTAAPNGRIYVIDYALRRIQRRAPDGRVLATIGLHQSLLVPPKLGELITPSGVAVARDGAIYVADGTAGDVQKLADRGPIRFVSRRFHDAADVAVGPRGTLYVLDGGACRIITYSPAGKQLTSYGGCGAGRGRFREPTGLAVDAQGDMFVADGGNDRVQKLSPTGRPLAVWGKRGSGRFSTPADVALDRRGDIYVADEHHDRIEKLSPSGRTVASVGGSGPGRGQFRLPEGIAVDARGNVYVADFGNSRVVKLSASLKPLSLWQ